MKLQELISQTDHMTKVGAMHFLKKSENVKGLHVIGTCGECEYYDSAITQIDQDSCSKRAGFWWEDDGCIHWEPKK